MKRIWFWRLIKRFRFLITRGSVENSRNDERLGFLSLLCKCLCVCVCVYMCESVRVIFFMVRGVGVKVGIKVQRVWRSLAARSSMWLPRYRR